MHIKCMSSELAIYYNGNLKNLNLLIKTNIINNKAQQRISMFSTFFEELPSGHWGSGVQDYSPMHNCSPRLP